MIIHPIRIQQKTVCSILDFSRETLRSVQRNDPNFPKAIKMGVTKQSPVFFDYLEILEWHRKQMESLTHKPSEVEL